MKLVGRTRLFQRMDGRHFQGLLRVQGRHQARQAGGQHALAGPRRPAEQQGMAASGGNFQYPFGGGLAADFRQAGALERVGLRCGMRVL